MQISRSKRAGVIAAVLMCALGGCAPVKQLRRPDPVDLGRFTRGDNRSKVVAALGQPQSSEHQSGNTCDVYRLYTRGAGGAGRAAIAATEAMADVLTLGLAEIVTNHVENENKSALHRVTFCYGADQTLIAAQDEGIPFEEMYSSALSLGDVPGGGGPPLKTSGSLFDDEKPTDETPQVPGATANNLFPEAAGK